MNGGSFYSGDSIKYINFYLNSKDVSFDFERLSMYYVASEGKDVLYHELLRVFCGFANLYLGGATVYYMTLIETLFGVLSSMTLYLILSEKYGKAAFKYTLLFSVFSYFLLYSCFIVRDIVIAYLFVEALRIVLGKFNFKNLGVLLLLIILSIGIRLQSGLFMTLYFVLYIYNAAKQTKYKVLANTIFIVVLAAAFIALSSSVIYEDSLTDLAEHQEETVERQQEIGGLFNMFFKLPFGIRQIAIMFFSQIAPFPPYGVLAEAHNFTEATIGLHVIICEIFWFLISYSLIICLFNKKTRFVLSNFDFFLLGVAAALLLLLTVHPDIRRMIPVYPIIYLSYIKIAETLPRSKMSRIKGGLIVSYIFLLLVYFSIKGF